MGVFVPFLSECNEFDSPSKNWLISPNMHCTSLTHIHNSTVQIGRYIACFYHLLSILGWNAFCQNTILWTWQQWTMTRHYHQVQISFLRTHTHTPTHACMHTHRLSNKASLLQRHWFPKFDDTEASDNHNSMCDYLRIDPLITQYCIWWWSCTCRQDPTNNTVL